MAYDAGRDGQQQRPYNGRAAQPPTARGLPQQQYGEFQNPSGYDKQGGGGYDQGYEGQYHDPRYAQGGPGPQDRYGPPRGGGARPPPGGRGGPPLGRPKTAEGNREGPYPPRGGMGHPPMPNGSGRGRPGPPHHPGGRPHPGNGVATPSGPGYGGSQYQGNQLADQMAGMDISNGRGYGPAPITRREPPPRGKFPGNAREPIQRRPAPGHQDGHGVYDNGYGQPGHSQNGGHYGQQRSMTMNSLPVSQETPPPRPSTTTGTRPPPQRIHHDASHEIHQDHYPSPAGHFSNYDNPDRNSSAIVDEFYDSYYDEGVQEDSEYGGHVRNQSRSSMPDFDAIPHDKRSSFEASMHLGGTQAQPATHQTAKLGHAKSMVDMREPQSAVFEMAGEIPDMPPLPSAHAYQPDNDYGYGTSGVHNQGPPRGPSAPPGAMQQGGFGNNQPIVRPGTAAPAGGNPDALPAHPTPVRAGLMQNSLPMAKPPPVRNYNGVAQTPPPQQQYQAPRSQQMAAQNNLGYTQPQPQEEAPVTPGELEHLRMIIKSNPNDQDSALRLAKRLLEASDSLVPNLPDPRARQRARERYVIDAQKILKKLSQAQNPEAMFMMADNIGKGLFGTEPDHKEAFTLYQSAAKLGHPAAAYRTAVCCEIGNEEGGGTRKDPMKAIQWYKRAATLGDPPAMYKVGMILLKGLLGQPKNPREAVGWLKRAAERADTENPHALHELGLLYESAQGNDIIIRDEQYALSLFQDAAELGYKFSQFKLGCAYEYGLMGCPIDPRLSIVWYSRAATQAEHQAELALSGWYLTGSEGVLNQSDTEAYLWARKAAVAGLAKAEYAMGYFTEVGIGVPANLEDAKRWYWRAAAQDFPKARDRLEDLKRAGKTNRPRPRERISRSQQQDGDCVVM